MNVKAVFHIKGRGMVAVLEDLPKSPIPVGAFLHQGERSWQIIGVEMASGKSREGMGVILRGEGEPQIGPIEF